MTPEQALSESEERFHTLIRLSSDWYWEQDEQLRFTRLEGQPRTPGRSGQDRNFIGMRRWETNLHVEGGWDAHRAMVEAHLPFYDIVMYREIEGKRRYLSISGEPVRDAGGRFTGYRGVGRDITTQIEAEEKVRFVATHDGLTGLPNRTMFGELLQVAVATARRYKRTLAVLFIDLDGFKQVNDRLGHAAGDALLNEIAGRLTKCLRASDVVARLGGDEFIALLQELKEPLDAGAGAQKILSAVALPLTIQGEDCRVTASIGICLYPQDARDRDALVKQADAAMYLAKQKGKNSFQFCGARG